MKRTFIKDGAGDMFAIEDVVGIHVQKAYRKSSVVVRFAGGREWEYPCYSRQIALNLRDDLIDQLASLIDMETIVFDTPTTPKAKPEYAPTSVEEDEDETSLEDALASLIASTRDDDDG